MVTPKTLPSSGTACLLSETSICILRSSALLYTPKSLHPDPSLCLCLFQACLSQAHPRSKASRAHQYPWASSTSRRQTFRPWATLSAARRSSRCAPPNPRAIAAHALSPHTPQTQFPSPHRRPAGLYLRTLRLVRPPPAPCTQVLQGRPAALRLRCQPRCLRRALSRRRTPHLPRQGRRTPRRTPEKAEAGTRATHQGLSQRPQQPPSPKRQHHLLSMGPEAA